ncbi:MAG: hypothetical protein BWY75_02508 [bacterium ADurb.Bin425]|nr:MAG: hypothetical protein BWY75_02508 [bacterium ADurb.Bin425]
MQAEFTAQVTVVGADDVQTSHRLSYYFIRFFWCLWWWHLFGLVEHDLQVIRLLHFFGINYGATLSKSCYVSLLHIVEVHGTAHRVAVVYGDDTVHNLQVGVFQGFWCQLVWNLVGDDETLSV